MNKVIALSIVLLIAAFSSSAHAGKTLKLNPKETKALTNSSPFTVNATCTVEVANKVKSKIKLSVLKNKCSVNGKHLGAGQTTSVTIKNNTSFSVSAESGTEINLMNVGAGELIAVCST